MLAARHAAAPAMFSGLARTHRIRDAAVVALCAAIIGGFVAHASSPAAATPTVREAMVATSSAAQPCPDVSVQ